MNSKSEILALLKEEFDHWEETLNGLTEQQIVAPHFIFDWSIKDTVAHLLAWQARSIARLEAAQLARDPEFPRWPAELDPDFVDDPDQINAWLYQYYREEPWPDVHRAWRAGFQHFLDLGQAIPEKDLLDPQKYSWMEGQPLLLVLQSSYDHHHSEHLESLLALLHQNG